METGSVLLVDDDADILEFLSVYLETSGHSVTASESGEAALAAIEAEAPELIIADIRMPGMSGYELCRRVRGSGRDRIPFIFCSALGGTPERIRGLRMGADDYVVKPVNPEELLLKVETILGRSRRLGRLEESLSYRDTPVLLEGSLGELSVPDLLQIADVARWHDVRLDLVAENGARGLLFLSGDRLLHAEADELAGLPAFHRLLGWSAGSFRVETSAFEGEPTIDRKLDGCLLEGVARLDHFRHLEERVGSHCARLRIRPAPEVFTRGFDDDTAAVLSRIAAGDDVETIVDECRLEDLQTLRIVRELLDAGVVEPVPGTGGNHGHGNDHAHA